VVPAVAEDISLSEVERTRGHSFAKQLSMRVLSRTWQMLLKGLADLKDAARPLSAAEMVLVRIAYAADLPTPDEVLRTLGDGQNSSAARQGNGGGIAPAATVPSALRYDAPRGGGPRAAMAPSEAPVARLNEPQSSAPVLVLGRFEDLIALAAEKRDLNLRMVLERDVRVVRFEDGQIEINVLPSAPKTLLNDLNRKLADWTGRRWMVAVSSEEGAPTLKEQAKKQQEDLEHGVQADPLVKAVLERFPGSKIVGVRKGAEPEMPAGHDALPSDDERED
jgi:DNA polymerase-3 subunit gamma/tau